MMKTGLLSLRAALVGRHIATGLYERDLPSDIDSPHKLWGFLNSAGNAMTEIPEDRFDVSNYPEIYVNSGAFLKTMYHFDNDVFKISESEAKLMDPKQRKCLELTLT